MKLISIIMPAYNTQSTISDSINSVLAQTYTNWELIVVNDCSTDETASIIKNFAAADGRIHMHTNKRNIGCAATRNAAISKARGQWLAFLDSDDLWLPDKLEKQLQFSEETKALITYTATSYINKHGKISNYVLPAEREFSYKSLLRRNIMSCSSVMVRADVMIPFPHNNAKGDMHEDYAAWLLILRKVGHAHGLNEPLLQYRLTSSSKSGKRLNSAKMAYRAYRVAGYNAFIAILLTLRYSLHSISKRSNIKAGYLS